MQLVTRGMMKVEEADNNEPFFIGDLSIQSILGFKPDPTKYAFYRVFILI